MCLLFIDVYKRRIPSHYLLIVASEKEPFPLSRPSCRDARRTARFRRVDAPLHDLSGQGLCPLGVPCERGDRLDSRHSAPDRPRASPRSAHRAAVGVFEKEIKKR